MISEDFERYAKVKAKAFVAYIEISALIDCLEDHGFGKDTEINGADLIDSINAVVYPRLKALRERLKDCNFLE